MTRREEKRRKKRKETSRERDRNPEEERRHVRHAPRPPPLEGPPGAGADGGVDLAGDPLLVQPAADLLLRRFTRV